MARDRTLLLHGAAVRTLDPGRPASAALVVAGNRIHRLLDEPADAPAGADRVDLGGACVLTGFTDAHVHFPSWATALRELRLNDARSPADVVMSVRAALERDDSGHWLRGRG